VPFSPSRAAPAPAGASLRSNFAWTLAGNAVYGAGQWAILSLFARLGGGEMLGEYAFAVAVATPAVMLSHLNLRAVLATDVHGRYSLGDYLAARFAATAAGLLGVALVAPFAARNAAMAAAILLAGVAQSAETVSDLYYGALQRRDRMDTIARSMMARGGAAVVALGAVLAFTHNLLAGAAAVAIARLAVLALYDRPRGSEGESLVRTGPRQAWGILKTALPLGVVLMLAALNTNLPRYAIERRLGARELGAFAAAASFLTVGSTVVNALGQAALPRLAHAFGRGERARFGGLALRLGAMVAALGVGGAGIAALAGAPLLKVAYRPEYAAYAGVLTAVMAAAVPVYLAGAFGYVVTATRAFRAQMPLACAAAAASGAAGWLLVPRLGLYGAALALGIAATVQFLGELAILGRALARRGAKS
jgi:O-antigen/teichoic acid export membrane protein